MALRTWGKIAILVALSLTGVWGALLSFGNPFQCAWPAVEDLIAAGGLSGWINSTGFTPAAPPEVEAVILRRVLRRGIVDYPFRPETDTILQGAEGSARLWKIRGDQLVTAEGTAALDEMEGREAGQFSQGGTRRLYRFAFLQAEPSHACVLVSLDSPVDGWTPIARWQMFKSLFGMGPWWILPYGSMGYGW